MIPTDLKHYPYQEGKLSTKGGNYSRMETIDYKRVLTGKQFKGGNHSRDDTN